jgi:hypothetical protein
MMVRVTSRSMSVKPRRDGVQGRPMSLREGAG